MKALVSLCLVLLSCLLIVTVAGCSSTEAQTEGASAVQPTATAVPTYTPIPTQTPVPSPCAEIEGECIAVTFTGEECVYDGPTKMEPALVTLIFDNSSQDGINFKMFEHKRRGNEFSMQLVFSYPVPENQQLTIEKRFSSGFSGGGRDYSLTCNGDYFDEVWFGSNLRVVE